jgi:hypothetical protein
MLSQDILLNADQSVECTILRRGIEALERTTRTKAPTHLPDWVMTEYDIDIDETSVLGRGGLQGLVGWSYCGSQANDFRNITKSLSLFIASSTALLLTFYSSC